MPEVGRDFDNLVKATVAAELSAKKALVGAHMRRTIRMVDGEPTYVDIPCPGSGKRPQNTFLEQIGIDPLAIFVKGLCRGSCGKDLTWNPIVEKWEVT